LWKLALLGAATFGLLVESAAAGGGPENVLLVVNSNSNSSKTIANHYIQLRNIPASNVVYIDWQDGIEWTYLGSFRDKLLKPVLKTIEERKLGHQIDYLVYSSDFPWGLRIGGLFPEGKAPPGVRPHASLTGATYLWQYVLAKNALLVSLNSNWYAPPGAAENFRVCQKLGNLESRGFTARVAWGPDGKQTDPKLGQRYLLSTMLGVTSGRGNTVKEVLSYLSRAASVDGKRPRGTIFFVKNSDIRSRTRHACFEEAAAMLLQLGVGARVIEGRIPQGAKDILGMMVGTPRFDLATAGDTILPGAICEHLTSFGGSLAKDGAQTPLTDFLRFGAAGASGTVSEPGAVQAKFPLPSLHVHYARGCSLAESFYQSIAAPYQLLIVGDPLCQPWAVIPKIGVAGLEPKQEVSGTLTVTPSAVGGAKLAGFQLFVDGRLVANNLPADNPISLDTNRLVDGYHELRVVGVADNAIATQGRAIVPFRVNNHGRAVELNVVAGDEAVASVSVRVRVRQPDATQIIVTCNSREVGRVEGAEGEMTIYNEILGRGQVALQAQSVGETAAISAPVWVRVR
jgi:uncharacterized protein (TIGR03790 family)